MTFCDAQGLNLCMAAFFRKNTMSMTFSGDLSQLMASFQKKLEGEI